MTALTLAQLNSASTAQALAWLDGVYEGSPWITEAAWAARPFASLAQLKLALANVVRHADGDRQLALLRAHPELAGRAMQSGELSTESTSEQTGVGLTHCSPQELAKMKQLNADYQAKFGWPFIVAVRGPRGVGLARSEIIASLERRLQNHAAVELAECLRQVHRIAELRLNEKFGVVPQLGNRVWDGAETLAQHSDSPEQLSVTYLTDAHRACAAQLSQWMREFGFDEVSIDAVGNVVGVYHAGPLPYPPPEGEGARRLLTGSHYDTVRNGGKYDGRLGILVPMVCVQQLKAEGRRLPFGIEVVGFAEEEGQRYPATFLGSSALAGQFNTAWLDQRDADGISMRNAMQHAGLRIDDIPTLARDASHYLGFVEVHIEQGPVLSELDLPLGVVTSINGSVRYLGEVIGTASHAGTTPMNRRRDAAFAVAELALYVEKRANAEPDCVGTVGILNVPNGSVNVIPGRCQFSLDLRATTNAKRDALANDVVAELERITARRGLQHTLTETLRAAAAPCDPAWRMRWEHAVAALGLPVFHLPSGAGHDAMKLHELMPQAMLFVRGGNSGISHNPLETLTNDDAELCVQAFQCLLDQLADDLTTGP